MAANAAGSHPRLAHVAGVFGVAGQLVAAYFFILLPALTVPSPYVYALVVSWFLLVGLAIAWWRHHPWRSFLAPMISVPAVLLVLEIGKRFWGWVA